MIYVIDGLHFSNLDEFWLEIERVFAQFIRINGKFEKNFSGFRELLSIFPKNTIVVWQNSRISLKILGYQETIRLLEKTLANCHPSWIEMTTREIEMAQYNIGETIFDNLVKIFVEQAIPLRLE